MVNTFRRVVGLMLGSVSRRGGAVAAFGLAAWLGGCASTEGDVPDAAPGATYTGPEYLFNSVGSLATINNNLPQLVSGYGLVVGLDGTGSSEVPQALRQWLINEMVKKGVGKTVYEDILPLGPESLLASTDTAVVRVVGFVPAGAVKGTRFDLLVTAADSTTTSLSGGRLWSCDLAAGSANPEQFYLTPMAVGRGPIYLDPTDTGVSDDEVFILRPERRTALVVAGGEVLEPRGFELVLNQASRQRAEIIGDRINERFRKAPSDPRPTANAISPLVIQLNLPERFHDRPQEFVELVNHTFIDRDPGFVAYQSRELAEVLINDPSQYESVLWAWKALGPNAAKVLREYYTHDRLDVRLASLEAGTYLQSEAASRHLLELAEHESVGVRIRVARALADLPSYSINGGRALRTLLDDKESVVRIAAYESLAEVGSELINRQELRDRNGNIRFVIDRVPVQDPLIYITQKDYPRLVIFNPNLGFEPGTLGRIWNDRLMIRRDAEDEPAVMFYQYRDPARGNELRTDQHDIWPTLATLAYVLAHEPSFDDPQQGYRLTYGEVADAVYQLARTGAVDAKVELDRGPLASLIDRVENGGGQAEPERPETAPVSDPGTAGRNPASPAAAASR
ncbi:MAG: flagellar basal body P-ring protein FlgI [Planctomycetota bacterium]